MTSKLTVPYKVWVLLSVSLKFKLLAAIPLSILSGVLDTLVIATGYFFVSSILSVETFAFQAPPALGWLSLTVEELDARFLGQALLVAFLFATLMRLFITYFLISVTNLVGAHLGSHLFRLIISNEFAFFVRTGPSLLINALTFRVGAAVNTVFAAVTIVSNAIMAMIIYFTVATAAPVVMAVISVTTLLFFGSFYFLVNGIATRNAQYIGDANGVIIRKIKEMHNAMPEIRLYAVADKFSDDFSLVLKQFFRLATQNTFVSVSPKIVIEAVFVMLAIGMVLVFGHEQGQPSNFLSILAFGLLALQRVGPLFQNIYKGVLDYRINAVVCSQLLDFVEDAASFRQVTPLDTLEDISEPIESFAAREVSFCYSDAKTTALSKVTFDLPGKGLVLIYGASGAGKTTLLNLVLGFLKPSHGSFMLNGKATDLTQRAWQRRLAVTRQNTTIIFGDITENIVFRRASNEANLSMAAQVAGVTDFVKTGARGTVRASAEDGSSFSGGEIQRIGIARGLYGESDVFVVDEPTSSLDVHRSAQVMELLTEISKTKLVIVCSHDQVKWQAFDHKLHVIGGTVITG